MAVQRLSRRDARRLAIRAQALGRDRPDDVLQLLQQVTLLQLDSSKAVAPSVDLVAWSRLGRGYRPEELQRHRDARALFEFRATLRPMTDLPLYRAEMAAWPAPPDRILPWQAQHRRWIEANDVGRRAVLHRLDEAGPLTARELPDLCTVPWRSSGWNNNRNVGQLLELMEQRGEIAVADRQAGQRRWDLAERVYPDTPSVPFEQAETMRNARRLAALGIARSRGPDCPVEPLDVGQAGVEAEVEGVRGRWRVDPEQLDSGFAGRAAILSPLDRLLHDRKRMTELFEFEYALEMYKPAHRRRWGYFALPILYGDRLVGKLDATSDRPAGVFRVNAVHWDEQDPGRAMVAAVEREIADLATWLQLDLERSG